MSDQGKLITFRVPFQLKVRNKVEKYETLLGLLGVLMASSLRDKKKELSKQDKQVLATCLVLDINSKDFYRKAGVALGGKLPENVRTYVSRLKAKGYIYEEGIKKEKKFSKEVEAIKQAVDSGVPVRLDLLLSSQSDKVAYGKGS